MLRSVFLKTIRDQRRPLLWWSIGLVLLALYVVLLYPSIRENASAYDKILKEMPKAVASTIVGEYANFASPEGYLNSGLFFLTAPLLFLVYTIAFGSGTTAGEEERGTLDLLLTSPLPRWRVVIEKSAAMVAATLVLAFFFWAALWIGAIATDMSLSAWRLAQITLSCTLLALAMGALGLALGCASGNRGLGLGVASTVAVAGYFLNSLGAVVEWLEPYRKLSPFYYYIAADPLSNGLNLAHAMVLLGLTVAFIVLAAFAFQRRDLRV